MSSIRVVVGIICMVLALVARGIWTESAIEPLGSPLTNQNDTTAVSEPLAVTEGDDAPFDEGDAIEPRTNESPRLDRYGNPIETAIGDYRIDRSGEIYERHSPDTAVVRLGVPSA